MRRLNELRAAIGSPRAVLAKLHNLLATVLTLFDRKERNRRYARLQAAGLAGERPTDWQLLHGTYRMMTEYMLPSNVEFYEHYEQNHWWQQVLRILDEPSAMADPIGLGVSKEMLISHLVQVVHTSAGYDVALLLMFEDGLPELRAQLQQLIAGTHPRQEAIEQILERPDYPAALLEALDRFEADPQANWEVSTVDAPEACSELFEWGIENFGTPGRLFAFCRQQPASFWEALREVRRRRAEERRRRSRALRRRPEQPGAALQLPAARRSA